MNDLPATPKDMKMVILSGIRTALLSLGSATKAELSTKLGISFPTISKFFAQMEREGELVVAGIDNSSGGRRATRYAYNPEFMLGVAIFLEKTETNYAIFNCLGEVKEKGTAPSVLMDDIQGLSKHIEAIILRYPKISALAIGVPGSVNNGRIIHIPDYEQFHDFDLKGFFEERLSIPVVVENDMNAAVLGYYNNKSNNDNPSLIYLYFGQNGPGAGILINGDVVRGSTFFSGEVSFVPQYDNRNFQQALQHDNGTDPLILHEERADAISRLVASCTAIINPHTIIFCHEEVDAAILHQIASRSAVYIPAEHLPALTMSDWKQDYLNGLQKLGLNLMITAMTR
ncbi:ROK family protein [Paenibacillus oenotherae]|uniref:ROK family protein n=1 Tax=Paenibacillus oenotherae TaxID=1435645 RepID=A0ABS7D5V7_9BACL|nr:ROK family protein [Paenibacillus oenotherae]MBW7475324.1 ROK family protein [Paenibacillus oenotherae]